MASFADAAKASLLVLLLVGCGASLGAVVSLQVLSRSRRRERAFTNEDTTALAFHIAKLSQQLIDEQARQAKRGERAVEQSSLVPLVEGAEMGLPVEDVAAELAQDEAAAAAAAAASAESVGSAGSAGRGAAAAAAPHVAAAEEQLKNSRALASKDTPELSEDALESYREEYKSWRTGKAMSKSSKLALTRRHNRSATQGDIDDLPDLFSKEVGEQVNAATLFHSLNMGPSAPQRKIKIAIIGGGAYGTAMAAAAGRNGHNVVIYVRRREQAREIKLTGRNDEYLPGLLLPPSVSATVSLEECMGGAELIIHALPAQKTPAWVRENKHLIPPHVVFCSTAKGLFLETESLLSTATLDAFGRDQPYAILSGPSFAKEIVTEQPTSVVVASKKLADAVMIQRVMSSTTFRIYASQDTVGVELGGALKNPLAIGAGMIEGLGFGINTQCAYVTRSCAELTALSVAMGGRPETIAGLAGVGDLMLTAFGSLSRNRSCGIRMVKGESVKDILASTTVEGVPTAKVAVAFAERCNLHLPIFRTVANILDGKLKASEFLMSSMMTRPLTMEHHTTPLSEVEGVQKAAAQVGKQCIL